MFSTIRLQTRTKELCKSYGKDWGLVLLVLIAFSAIDQIEPFHRQFSVKDTTIQHPFAKKETVPVWLLLILAFVLPLTFVGVIAVFQRRSYTDLHNGFLGLFLTQALVLIVTDSIKIAVGRTRPDFLDRCFSLYDNMAAGTPVEMLYDPVNILSNSTICTRQDLLRDGFKSFPSGHSSFSFGGLGYLSMYLAGKIHLFDERGHTYKSLVVLAPMILAALIAASRVADYRHHWQDVSVGAIIGSLFAIYSYRQYYPSLAAVKCDCPFSPRVNGGKEQLLPTHLLHGDALHPSERYHDDPEEEENTVRHGSAEADGGDGVLGQFFRREAANTQGANKRPGANGSSAQYRGSQQSTNNDDDQARLITV
ncbi:diacylglycerol diphosphate phosphatase / phosphatidate phosphatase [Entomortierella parvispora]|uniref:Diacylglycerol diphosphate phosphatase / phosphatidate phosphatase n=1 Tax=Entomortierella parvispora TaxID=205924 RepID=A0A9P3HGF5_9FUNG|nr:diacylglycerol diphosphate phosphatase / phosphatidate phosphatase [Entomortierella parvispora]